MITRTYVVNYRSITVHYDKPVESCHCGSCGIMERPNSILLVSYTTVCGELTNDGWLTPCHYSTVTTAKHIRAFIRDYVSSADPNFDYKKWKKLVDKNVSYNIHTGEIKEVT